MQLLEAKGADDLERAFETAARGRADALVGLPDTVLSVHGRRLADLAIKHRLPTMYWTSSLVESGGLMSYGPNLREMHRRAATYVDKILKGAKVADLPVEQPAKFAFVVNLKTAKALGLTLPQTLVLRADRVLQ
jgi:putative ABC transport system substrate-binding protein